MKGHPTFKTISIDPPWPEKGGGKIKRGADRHYKTMAVEAIGAMRVHELARPQAHLYLWVTNNFLEAGFWVLRQWGFKYITCVTWGKVLTAPSGASIIQTGLGQYYRGASEHLLFARCGKPLPYRKDPETGKRAQGRTLVLAPRTSRHSEKPAVFYQHMERVSPGPYLEMFARDPRPGWTVWGNEVKSPVNDVLTDVLFPHGGTR